MLRFCSGLFAGVSDRDAAVGCGATIVKDGRHRQRWSVGKTESLVDVVVVVVGELPIRREHWSRLQPAFQPHKVELRTRPTAYRASM